MTEHTTTATALREIADFVEQLPESVPTPAIDDHVIRFHVWHSAFDAGLNEVRSVAQEVRHIARSIGGRWHKNDPSKNSYEEMYYTLTHDQKIGGRKLEVLCFRSQVCERVQVGTETVQVPAVVAQEARTVERPVFQYECRPLVDAAGRELDDVLAEVTA